MKRRLFLSAAPAAFAGAVGLGATHSFASAPYPTRAVRLIVPVAVGGSADKLARTLAQKLSESWGQRVVVENVAGASGSLGAALVAKSAPDGHTLLLGGDSLSLLALQPKNLTFDPLKDLVGVVKAVVNPQLLLVRPGLGVNNLEQFVALAKSRPGQVSLALPGGIGSLQHLAVELLAQRTGIKLNSVPYLGGGPAMVDVIGGHVDATLITLAAATEYVRSGKVTAGACNADVAAFITGEPVVWAIPGSLP
ncbi:MAG: tripartite tricarboxylate transporter substrate-binding protein, partial [Pseudomonadota bacterium]